MARSALENVAQMIETSRKTSAALVGESVVAIFEDDSLEPKTEKMLDPSVDFSKTFVYNEELENLMLKTLFATRIEESDKAYKATNISYYC